MLFETEDIYLREEEEERRHNGEQKDESTNVSTDIVGKIIQEAAKKIK